MSKVEKTLGRELTAKILSVYLHVFPVLLFISLELQNSSRIFGNIPALLVSCALIYATLLILFSLTGRVFLSGLLASIMLISFYTASFYRHMQTGQVLVPQDLNLARHVASIFAFSNLSLHWKPVCSLLCVAALHVPLFHASKRIRFSIKKRAVIFTLSGVFVSLALFTQFSQRLIMSAIDNNTLENESFNEIYREQGALLGFYTIGTTDVDEPEGYSQVYMESLADFTEDNLAVGNYGESIKPDVIVVMSEAYWDPTRLPNITFSEDPVPNWHALSGKTTSGNVISPTFGGMTCNTEFEFLTGHSMNFVGYGDIPYFDVETYIDHDNGRSLVSMFRASGYRTMALHTYTATFFGRDIIYPKLGFETFIAEEDLPGAPTKGSLRGQDIISDEYFCDVLLETIESAADPLFLFGITVQNHTPYLPDKYETTRIQADSGGLLPEEDEEYVETYLEGVRDADTVLGRLYDYVMESDKPTILVYFGDHLPILTQHTGLYTDLGYIGESEPDELSAEDAYKLFSTPYIVFSNYAELPDTWGDISTFYLGALIAQAAGIELNLYYNFLIESLGCFQALNPYVFIADGVIYNEPREDDLDMIDMFAAFQYDKLFGEGYLDDAVATAPSRVSR